MVSVGSTGVLTPFAILEPVFVSGATVSIATLHNEDEINRKGLMVGDLVRVKRAGEVIPEVVGPLVEERTGQEREFIMPSRCPVCGADAPRAAGEVARFCTDYDCPARAFQRIVRFAAREAMDISGLGERTVSQLMRAGLLRDPSDIFFLAEKDLVSLPGWGKKRAASLLRSIEERRRPRLDKLLYGLGIPGVGDHVAEVLASHFGEIEAIVRADPADLMHIKEIGPTTAESVSKFFRRPSTGEVLGKLRKASVEPVPPPKPLPGRLLGKSFVFTGTLSTLSRERARALVRQQGGDTPSSVTKSTDYLVAGDSPGSKLEKAMRIGVKVIDEEEFLRISSEQ
jgi:DNA ligase (NAD+)